MTQEEMKKLTESITKKLGKENSGIILDDLGMLLTDNAKMNETIDLQAKSIESEKAKNEKLLATNSSLLQQVGVSSESIFKSFFKDSIDFSILSSPIKIIVSGIILISFLISNSFNNKYFDIQSIWFKI